MKISNSLDDLLEFNVADPAKSNNYGTLRRFFFKNDTESSYSIVLVWANFVRSR